MLDQHPRLQCDARGKQTIVIAQHLMNSPGLFDTPQTFFCKPRRCGLQITNGVCRLGERLDDFTNLLIGRVIANDDFDVS
jgi:hypothetical protein